MCVILSQQELWNRSGYFNDSDVIEKIQRVSAL